MTPARLHPGRGFSLVEIMVVLVVMAILAAMALPELTGRNDMASLAASRRLTADMEYAQNLAITSQADVYVTFDRTNNLYRLTDANNADIPHPVIHTSNFVVDFDTLNGAQGVKISTVTFPNSKVKFTSLGAPDNAGSVTLTCSSRSYVVSVAAVTGRVTINPGP